jgi:hypothetical protein
MSTLMRDISAQIAILDMMRGAASIYMLYLGYDEVAHHSGPWTRDAFGDLKRLDKTLARLRRAARERAPRPYDFIILSDHGQSFGATFRQRYGLTIKEFIEQQLPQGTTVGQSIGGDTGAFGLQGVAGELANLQDAHATHAVNTAVARQGQKLAQKGADAGEKHVAATQAAVTAYGSGNAAQVYFDLFPRKIKLSELNAAYPGMVDALVQHEGIGMVLGYEDDMTVVVLGKRGRRNLHTGEVIGEDPVAPYAPAQGPGAASMARHWCARRSRASGERCPLATSRAGIPEPSAFRKAASPKVRLCAQSTSRSTFSKPAWARSAGNSLPMHGLPPSWPRARESTLLAGRSATTRASPEGCTW